MKKRIISIVIVMEMFFMSIVGNEMTILTEASNNEFIYTLLSLSKEESLDINVQGGNIGGNIASNNKILIGNINNNGKLYENIGAKTPILKNKIYEEYFDDDVSDILENLDEHDLNKSKRAIKDVKIMSDCINGNNITIVSEEGNVVLDANNISISGLIYAPNGEVILRGNNVNLNGICIIANKIVIEAVNANINPNKPIIEWISKNIKYNQNEKYLYIMGECEESIININWETNYCDSDVILYESSDNIEYKKFATVRGENYYIYNITEEFNIKYFKASVEDVISIPFIVKKTKDGYCSSLLDSDLDDIPDILESLFGTNIYEQDSDNDGLSDYDELIKTNSDPCVYDSLKPGVLDSLYDIDGDGLDNKTELKYGTDPLKTDTDDDGLNDNDEIFKYNTNPLLADTDSDGLKDISEIRLGTNPRNSDSNNNNIIDGEEMYEQIINTEKFDDNIFHNNIAIPSIKVNEIGDANESIRCKEYTGYLKGDGREFIGKCIEVSGSKAESGKISYKLSEDYIVPSYTYGQLVTNGLLVCVNIDEETIPLETFYDEETRELSADFVGDGIYFIMNTIFWLDSIGIDPKDTINDIKNNVFGEEKDRIDVYSGEYNELKDSNNGLHIAGKNVSGQVDIVFVIDTTGSMRFSIDNVRQNINSFVDVLEQANIKPYFSLVEYKDITCDGEKSTNVKINSDDNTYWFSSVEKFKDEIENLAVYGGGDNPETVIDGLEFARQLNMRASSQKFFILVTDAEYKEDNNYNIKSMDEMTKLLIKDKVNISVITDNNYRKLYEKLYSTTGGIFADINGNFKNELLGIADKIIDFTNDGSWIALNGLLPLIVKLEEKPKYGSNIDTDMDGITDVDELENLTPVKKLNVVNFIRKLMFKEDIIENTEKWDVYVYNYKSNPTKRDTDEDGLDDLLDNEPKNGEIHDFVIYDTFQSDFWVKDGTDQPDDYKYGDMTKQDILNIKKFSEDDFILKTEKEYISLWRLMIKALTIASDKDMKVVAMDMINHFIDGTGADYRNDILTLHVMVHPKMQKYEIEVKERLNKLIEQNDGKIKILEYDYNEMRDDNKRRRHPFVSSLQGVSEPVFNDLFSGLGICVDSLYGNRISITSFKYNDGNYEYTIKFELYDIYGLDSSDIKDCPPGIKVPFGTLRGFRNWYILQHYDKFKGNNVPYFSYMDYEMKVGK